MIQIQVFLVTYLVYRTRTGGESAVRLRWCRPGPGWLRRPPAPCGSAPARPPGARPGRRSCPVRRESVPAPIRPAPRRKPHGDRRKRPQAVQIHPGEAALVEPERALARHLDPRVLSKDGQPAREHARRRRRPGPLESPRPFFEHEQPVARRQRRSSRAMRSASAWRPSRLKIRISAVRASTRVAGSVGRRLEQRDAPCPCRRRSPRCTRRCGSASRSWRRDSDRCRRRARRRCATDRARARPPAASNARIADLNAALILPSTDAAYDA